MTDSDLIEACLEIENMPNCGAFIESVAKWHRERGFITDKQRKALQAILEKSESKE